MKKLKPINKFLVQCHRIAPSLTAIQVAIILVMYEHDEITTQQEIMNELGISRALVNRQLKPLFDASGREMVIMKGWNCLYLSHRGERYCRSLLTNAEYFFNKLSL